MKTPDMTQMQQDYAKLMTEQMGRMNQAMSEMVRLHAEATTQATRAIDDMAKMMKDSLSHAQQMTAEFHKMSVEGTKRAADWMQPKA